MDLRTKTASLNYFYTAPLRIFHFFSISCPVKILFYNFVFIYSNRGDLNIQKIYILDYICNHIKINIYFWRHFEHTITNFFINSLNDTYLIVIGRNKLYTDSDIMSIIIRSIIIQPSLQLSWLDGGLWRGVPGFESRRSGYIL